MNVQAVLFDCDGVLVDSEPATFDLLGEDLAAHGLAMSHDEMERMFIGGTIEGVAHQAREMGRPCPPIGSRAITSGFMRGCARGSH